MQHDLAIRHPVHQEPTHNLNLVDEVVLPLERHHSVDAASVQVPCLHVTITARRIDVTARDAHRDDLGSAVALAESLHDPPTRQLPHDDGAILGARE